MRYLVFRFDIDTPKCIRDGVPNLLSLAEKYDLGFTFFLNPGRSISVIDSLKQMILTKKNVHTDIKMMSALQKLGVWDYFYTAIINPNVSDYTENIKAIYDSKSELGLHGGRNHALWARNVLNWDDNRIEREINWAVKKIKKIESAYEPIGFASPEWISDERVEKILKRKGFQYIADYRCAGEKMVIWRGKYLPYIGTNLCGEPGGVAYFEYCRVKGMSTHEIVDEVIDSVKQNDVTVLFDHPYYAGLKEIECMEIIIQTIKTFNDVRIVTLSQINVLEEYSDCKNK